VKTQRCANFSKESELPILGLPRKWSSATRLSFNAAASFISRSANANAKIHHGEAHISAVSTATNGEAQGREKKGGK
jgi:hypothetical protein